jgi:hypothetical protein
MSVTLLEKIRTRCEVVGDCWLWKQGCSDGGMPIMGVLGKTRAVRRVVYAETHGSIPEGKKISPRCGHKKCVSPECLCAVTQKQATQAAAKRGAYSGAAKILKTALTMRARSKYSDEVVERIRTADGPAHLVAAETGVSLSHAKNIRRGTARKDYLDNPFAGLGARP